MNNQSTIDFDKLYLSDEVFTILVTETNRFAKQFLAAATEKTRTNSYVGKWVPVTLPEMKRFLGLVILMGIIYKPSIPLYWSTDELLSTPSQLVTRNRFQLIGNSYILTTTLTQIMTHSMKTVIDCMRFAWTFCVDNVKVYDIRVKN